MHRIYDWGLIAKFTILSVFCISFHSNADVRNSLVNQQFEGLIREPMTIQVVLDNGKPAILDAFVTRPAGPGKYPIVIINHGTSESPEFDRTEMTPNRTSATALAFATHGYAAVSLLREGYGFSSGGAEYTGGSCKEPLHKLAGKRDVRDILAALEVIRKQPWALPENTVLAGMSAGGFAVIATGAVNPPGVTAVISFDGGRGSIDGRSLCDRKGLLAAYSSYGKTARIPSLWLYSINDKSFPPQMGKDFFNAYHQWGADATFMLMPAFENNGHAFMDSAPGRFWWSHIEPFLKEHNLPYKQIVSIPENHLPMPENLNNEQGKAAFEKYTASELYEKAFATGKDGAWGVAYWERDGHTAAADAIESCEAHQPKNAQHCNIYAINNIIVNGGAKDK